MGVPQGDSLEDNDRRAVELLAAENEVARLEEGEAQLAAGDIGVAAQLEEEAQLEAAIEAHNAGLNIGVSTYGLREPCSRAPPLPPHDGTPRDATTMATTTTVATTAATATPP